MSSLCILNTSTHVMGSPCILNTYEVVSFSAVSMYILKFMFSSYKLAYARFPVNALYFSHPYGKVN